MYKYKCQCGPQNKNLHLCCLLTYCCLLRPHQEIRLLKWSDYSDDLSTIRLSGDKVKSKRNRIVPVPFYIRELLVKGEPHHNIFSGRQQPLNEDYFKTLWGRFKRVSKLLEQDQTLYSFRHSGAIEIFKRTGSITKLQKAMGHSSINVSLTYLRGLEIAELERRRYAYFTLTNTTYLDISLICSVSGNDCSLVLEGKSMLLGSTSMRFNT